MLDIDEVFDFQKSMSISAINNETIAFDRKVCEFLDSISASGEAKRKIFITGDTKDAETFYSVKKHEAEEIIKWN